MADHEIIIASGEEVKITSGKTTIVVKADSDVVKEESAAKEQILLG